MYTIEVISSFEEYWRYNTILMCGGYSDTGEELYVVSQKDVIAEVGDEIRLAPKGYTSPRVTVLECEECDNIRLMVYMVPNTLPKGSKARIENFPPFDATIIIRRGDELIYDEIITVNQWSGISKEIKI